MSETLEIWRDGAIGETREALVRDGRVIALSIWRASDEGRRARWGEVYAARVQSVDRRRRGAFVDLGLSDDVGFLPLDAAGQARRHGKSVAVREGEAVVVSVSREGARGKGPVLALVNAAHPGGAPLRIARHESDDENEAARPAPADARARIDAALDDALARTAPIPGGGVVTIEPTAALVAVDVDAAGRAGTGDAEKFALDLNSAAAKEIALQTRLRNLGGIFAIDFVSLRTQAAKTALIQALKDAYAGDPWGAQFGQLSRFGVFEMTRPQLRAPLHEVLRDTDGRLSLETVALKALRAIEREGAAQGGRRIAATVAPEIHDWLEKTPLAWRAALDARIGPRWSIEAAPGPRERIDVRAL